MSGYPNRRRRSEAGATTAEYVGILAFVALLAVAVIGFVTPIGSNAKSIASDAYCKIGATLGGAGCSNEQLPHYIPTKCTLSSTGKQYGGSVSVVATVGGDTGYTIYRIRERQDDGTFKDKYVVKTKGSISGSYEFGPKAGAEVDTGKGGADAEGGASVTIGGDIETGSSYSFGSEEEAKAFADKNKDNFGGVTGVEGGPEADSTYYQAGANAEVKGEAGPLSASGKGKVVLGVETFKNGDTKFKMALTVSAALELGIPVPEAMMEASAKGQLSLMVQADVTFDKNGDLIRIGGTVEGTAQGEAGVDMGPGQGTKKGDTLPDGSTANGDKWQLPGLNIKAGGKVTLAFDTQFDDKARGALSDAAMDFVSGDGLTDEAKDAINEQITQNSQVTVTTGTYNEDKEQWGGKVKVLVVTVGAEGHVITTNEDTVAGWYLNTESGNWEENLACGA